jgi:hypothetical protein
MHEISSSLSSAPKRLCRSGDASVDSINAGDGGGSNGDLIQRKCSVRGSKGRCSVFVAFSLLFLISVAVTVRVWQAFL